MRSSSAANSRSVLKNVDLNVSIQLDQCARELARIGRPIMPEQLVLHEAHTLALHGVRHNTGWSAPHQGYRRERSGNFVHVVSVDLANRPAERFPFFGQGL